MSHQALVTCASLVLCGGAVAQPYVVGSLGTYSSTATCDPGYFSPLTPVLLRCHERPESAAVRFGYQWQTGLGVELSYLHAGRLRSAFFEENIRFVTDANYGVGTYVEQRQKFTNHTLALSILHRWPILTDSSIAIKGGLAVSRGHATSTIVTRDPRPAGLATWQPFDEDKTRAYLGADLVYRIGELTSVQLSLDFFTLGYNKTWPGTTGGVSQDVRARLLTIGLRRSL